MFYTTEDGKAKIEVKLENKTVWVSQMQMTELFQTTKQNISDHIKNIYESGELEQIGTVKDFLTVQKEENRKVQRTIQLYNLDIIISVGYRTCVTFSGGLSGEERRVCRENNFRLHC